NRSTPSPAVSLYGACQGVSAGRRIFFFVGFFVRSESPFLRPDPRVAYAGVRRAARAQKPDGRQLARLLRAPRERPDRTRAADEGDDLASPHMITSSPRNIRDSGIIKPTAVAALRLITSSNLVGNCTGSSPGLAPRRMRST